MPSVCIRAILFTPIGKQASDNKYIEVFLLWLSQLIKAADLQPNDALELLIDSPTLQQLQQTSFPTLFPTLQCQKNFIQLPQPSNLTEGCMWKYLCINYTQDIFFYCDIDILITNSIHRFTACMQPNTLYAHVEGQLFHQEYGTNYSADISAEYLSVLPSNSPGYSAGKFFVYGKEIRDRFFQHIQKLYMLRKMDYPMLEQPFYNRAIYEFQLSISLDTSLLTDITICRNNVNYNKGTTILLDCYGVPGDDTRHLTKFVYAVSLLNAGIY
jgi:hypothetical protein